MLKKLFQLAYDILNVTRKVDFFAPLALRLYLAPIFLTFGFNKLNSFDSVVQWFGNPDWGLGLPAPALMATLAIGTEIIGGFALLFGVLVRWFSIPLMITMLVAALTAHIQNGWFAVAPGDPKTNLAYVTQHVGFPGAKESLENSEEVSRRVSAAKNILREHGNYDWLTEKGNFVVLNNGVEFAVTYFIMLLCLFFMGAGRYLSFDYWLGPYFVRDIE